MVRHGSFKETLVLAGATLIVLCLMGGGHLFVCCGLGAVILGFVFTGCSQNPEQRGRFVVCLVATALILILGAIIGILSADIPLGF